MAKSIPKNPSLWRRVQAEAKKKFDVTPCVSTEYMAVTRDGPRGVDDIAIGTDILAYDMERDVLAWTPVQNIHAKERARVVRMRKPTGFSLICTPNHKWVRERATNDFQTGPHGRKSSGVRRELVETRDINTNSYIVFCARLPDAAGNREGAVPANWTKHDRWVPRVLAMTAAEREAFLASAIIYDGCDHGASKVRDGRTFAFTQRDEDHAMAAFLAAFCNGYHVSMAPKPYTTSKGRERCLTAGVIIRGKRCHRTYNIIIEDAGEADVWCPETSLGTWVMSTGRNIVITGNSAYSNAWAAKEYKARGGTWGGADNRVKKG